MSEKDRISMDEFERLTHNAENNYNDFLLKHIKKILTVLIIFCLYMFLPKTLWLIPSKLTNEKLDPYKEPVLIENQENIKAALLRKSSDYDKLIKYKSFKNGKTYYLMPLADYSITARVLEKNTFFYMQWDIDNVSLVDYGFAWGDMAKKEYFNKIYSNSNQTVTARRLVFRLKDKYRHTADKKFYDYLFVHASHTHTIPANRNVKKALSALQRGQIVKLEGYLVDVYDSNYRRFALTSLSLSDINESSRGHDQGGGACEVMYVTKVQVGKKVFK